MTIDEQINCAIRELKMRNRVYPRLVESEKMSTETARHEIECMAAILNTLQRVKEKQEGFLF